ncbi:YqaA family protein [Croceimicrobium sp.]|uniref:YqaA family protein n=1 Tax=Croceimicrobium sp. TaxID=2828340 RepID=UPI003BA8617F
MPEKQKPQEKPKSSKQFIRENIAKLIWTFVIFMGFIWAVNYFLIDVNELSFWLNEKMPVWSVFLLFFSSESLLGILPPDLFIIWSQSLPEPWLSLTVLAFLSYVGGIISFGIGRLLNRIPAIDRLVHKRYTKLSEEFRTFGALAIFLAALTPLPFSPVSIIAGSLDYPLARYLLVALSRILRYFIYASFLFYLY